MRLFHLTLLLLASLASAAPLHPDYITINAPCSTDPRSPTPCGPGLECILPETPLQPASCKPLILRRQADSSPSPPTNTAQSPDTPTALDASPSSTIDDTIPTTNNEPPPAAQTTEEPEQQSSSSPGLPVSVNPPESETTTSVSSTRPSTTATSKSTSVALKTTSLFAPSIGPNVRSSSTVVGDRTATIAPLSNVGLIVGGACGFLVLVLVAVLVFFYMKPAEVPLDVFDDFVAKRRATYIREDAQRQRLQKSRPYAQLEE
ncbi:hypothetical protein BJ741DRAFT_627655 [Chytriomyces cf. hyalinus JEL632]|nr:hypothetical protein BJ741DRAFT_627655 [Chytriomyces cf. hyalinus JEL632]